MGKNDYVENEIMRYEKITIEKDIWYVGIMEYVIMYG
jgi:hypothetical protein